MHIAAAEGLAVNRYSAGPSLYQQFIFSQLKNAKFSIAIPKMQ